MEKKYYLHLPLLHFSIVKAPDKTPFHFTLPLSLEYQQGPKKHVVQNLTFCLSEIALFVQNFMKL